MIHALSTMVKDRMHPRALALNKFLVEAVTALNGMNTLWGCCLPCKMCESMNVSHTLCLGSKCWKLFLATRSRAAFASGALGSFTPGSGPWWTPS